MNGRIHLSIYSFIYLFICLFALSFRTLKRETDKLINDYYIFYIIILRDWMISGKLPLQNRCFKIFSILFYLISKRYYIIMELGTLLKQVTDSCHYLNKKWNVDTHWNKCSSRGELYAKVSNLLAFFQLTQTPACTHAMRFIFVTNVS